MEYQQHISITSGRHNGRGAHGTGPGGDWRCIRLLGGVSGAGAGSGAGAWTRWEEVDAVTDDVL